MLNIYTGRDKDKKILLNGVLSRHITTPFEILRTENGKPYIKDNPVYFNTADSGKFCAVAVSDSPVGIDMEVYGKGIRQSVLRSYNSTERAEIQDEKEFLKHWTAREAYIKYCGGTLAHMLELMKFCDGVLSFDGKPVTPQPEFNFTENYVLAVCGKYDGIRFENIP